MKMHNINPIVDYLRRFSNFHSRGKLPDVFIFSMPRSGSTWLMELIWSQPGFKYCNEPLNLKGEWLQKQSGINGFNDLYSDGVKDRLVNYFKGISNGRNHNFDPNPKRTNYRFFTKRIVYKVIHGGEKYINDIADACNGKVVYLLRHPIPVALSRKVLPRMDQLCSDFVLQHFSKEEKELALNINCNGNEMERRMLAWCIQNKFALLQRKSDWVVVTYEQLTVDPGPVIHKLVEKLNLPSPERIFRQLDIPSAVSVQSQSDFHDLMRLKGNERDGLINRWMEKVKPDDAKSLMEICIKFGFDIYNYEGSMPSAKWLIE